MSTYYVKRALEILQNEGAVELFRSVTKFISYPLDPRNHRYFRFLSFNFYTQKNHLQNRIYYEAPPDPHKTIDIRTNKIKERAGQQSDFDGNKQPIQPVQYRGLAQTKNGEWDCKKHRTDVKNLATIQAMAERFDQNKDWQETEYYQNLFEKCNKHNIHKSKGFNNLETYLKEYFTSYDNLFKDIQDNGYKPDHKSDKLPPGSTQPLRSRLEILVTIGRNGTIYLYGGHHRFGIARVLDLEVPAHVVCRHTQWQELRDVVHNSGLPEGRTELRYHPDLQDILN